MTKQYPFKKSESWKMFDTIADRYDVLNTILSAGILNYWRSRLVKSLPKQSKLSVLDCATGTGEVMAAILKKRKADIDSIIGIDLSKNMMEKGKHLEQKYPNTVSFKHASATKIPYPDHTFDCVTISFGIRNVSDYRTCLKEIHRVLKPNGCALIMEFALPKNRVLKALYLLYFRHILPLIAGCISGNKKAYRYLNETVESFPYGSEFISEMEQHGFVAKADVLTCGIVNLYVGQKSHD